MKIISAYNPVFWICWSFACSSVNDIQPLLMKLHRVRWGRGMGLFSCFHREVYWFGFVSPSFLLFISPSAVDMLHKLRTICDRVLRFYARVLMAWPKCWLWLVLFLSMNYYYTAVCCFWKEIDIQIYLMLFFFFSFFKYLTLLYLFSTFDPTYCKLFHFLHVIPSSLFITFVRRKYSENLISIIN